MSCRENCGSLNNATSKSQNAFSRTAPPPSHRPVHIAIERSPDQMVSNLSEYSGYGNLRTPPATRASTPGPYGYPCQFDTFGSQIADYNLSWMPKDIDLSELLNHNGQIPSRFRRADQRVSVIVPNATPPPTVSTPLNANPLLEKEQERDQLTPQMKKNERERRESLMEWFDRSIEKELKKHRSSSFLATPYSHPVSPTAEPQLNLSKGTLERLSGATASQIEMCLDLRKEPDTELVDAVEKFATAEARCAFAGAVKAAEAAAVAAPPDLVEEAALASARGFQTDIKASSVQGELQGLRPVEVLGYIGVTNPKYPTKREHMQSGRRMRTKEIGINANRSNEETDITTSETNNDWKSPTKLKQDVQTIIDIMETTITPYNYNTSSDADNEESVLTNSKLSMNKSLKKSYLCNEDTETKSKESTDKTSKENLNISTAADVNSTLSVTMDEFTDSKFNFPYVENICNNNPYICPPPLIPANVCINSECICPQVASILHGRNIQLGNEGFLNLQEHNIDLNISNENKVCKTSKNVVNWFKTLVSTSKSIEGGNNICGNEYYKMNIKRKRGNDHSPPKRVVFELVQNYPKTCNDTCNNLYDSKEILCESTTKENLKNERLQAKANLQCFCKYKMEKDLRKPPRNIEKNEYCDHSGRTRVDFYYFDHGASNYYQTTDASPVVTTQEVADKTEKYTTRFWAEIFGTVHIGLSFFTSFILQFLRLILYSICRPLTIGFIQLGSDYVFKPLLASLFNGLLQPIFIFFYNIFGSIRDICDPISEGIGYFFKEFSILIRAFRIVEIKNENCGCQNECKCEKKSKKSKLSH